MEIATAVTSFLDRTIKRFRVKKILDLGCGDWNWMRHADFVSAAGEDSPVYTGWDSHDVLIESLSNQFGSDRIGFAVKDVVESGYPKVDLIIARDVLFHLSNDQARKVVKKAAKSAKYFICTSFNDYEGAFEPAEYLSIKNWRFGLINTNSAEFGIVDNFVEQVLEPGCKKFGFERHVNLYRFS